MVNVETKKLELFSSYILVQNAALRTLICNINSKTLNFKNNEISNILLIMGRMYLGLCNMLTAFYKDAPAQQDMTYNKHNGQGEIVPST